MNKIESLFDKLDKWRNLPAYQLERRADIFFSLYLPDLIKQQCKVGTKLIIPEFPIRIGEIDKRNWINKSFKIDYLVITEREGYFILIELKTDSGSRRGKQDAYLMNAKKIGIRKLMDGLIKICGATQSKDKYANLMKLLQSAGLVSISNKKYKNLAPKNCEIDVMYIQPSELESQATIVSLHQFAGVVREHSDDLSQRFADSLERWDKTKAGEDMPPP